MAMQVGTADRGRIVAHLADQAQRPIAEIALLYEQELAELAATARVTSYLHIFAVRNVQASLQARSRQDH